jgi:hypothetical protein
MATTATARRQWRAPLWAAGPIATTACRRIIWRQPLQSTHKAGEAAITIGAHVSGWQTPSWRRRWRLLQQLLPTMQRLNANKRRPHAARVCLPQLQCQGGDQGLCLVL